MLGQVRSFVPLEAFMFSGWYARLASKPYNLTPDSVTDFSQHFTVASYDPELASTQVGEPSVRQSAVMVASGMGTSPWAWRKLMVSIGRCELAIIALVSLHRKFKETSVSLSFAPQPVLDLQDAAVS